MTYEVPMGLLNPDLSIMHSLIHIK